MCPAFFWFLLSELCFLSSQIKLHSSAFCSILLSALWVLLTEFWVQFVFLCFLLSVHSTVLRGQEHQYYLLCCLSSHMLLVQEDHYICSWVQMCSLPKNTITFITFLSSRVLREQKAILFMAFWVGDKTTFFLILFLNRVPNNDCFLFCFSPPKWESTLKPYIYISFVCFLA